MPKILLAEDSPELREMLARRLEKKKFTVVLATNGQEACTVALAEKPDLILMDWTMPVMDGMEATRRLKADPETQAIPIIALTAHAMAEHRQKALAAGCNEHETKPVDMPALLAKMETLLQGGAS